MLIDDAKKAMIQCIRELHHLMPDVLSDFEVTTLTLLVDRIKHCGEESCYTTVIEWGVVEKALADLRACAKIDAHAKMVHP